MFKKAISTMVMLYASGAITLAQSPTPAGSVIPESITFTIADVADNGGGLTNLRSRNFDEFEGQVVVAVYFASW